MQRQKALTVKGYECYRCGYKWQPRKKGRYPRQCARCHSVRWDEKR